MVIAVCVLLGLLIGSFLNVVIWRLPQGASVVRPPSHCPGCKKQIRPRDNLPVLSWLLLRGRCRDCATRISARYPAVELLTAVVFALGAWHFGLSWELPAFLYLGAVGIALALIDIDTKRLPNALTLPSYAVGIAALALAAVADHAPCKLARALIGMAALYCLYFALAFIYPAGMGFGDVKLAGVLGLFLGYVGWGALVVGGFLAFLLGGVVGAVLMALRYAGRKSAIPFGPYMIAGAFVAIGLGERLAHLYTDQLPG